METSEGRSIEKRMMNELESERVWPELKLYCAVENEVSEGKSIDWIELILLSRVRNDPYLKL